MPHRAPLLLGLIGVLLVGLFVLLGRDPRAAARRGSALRRVLLGAGLALLGLAACGSPVNPADRELAAHPEWRHVAATWAEAEDVASGKRGNFPFDEKGQARLLADLAKAPAELDALVAAGTLAPEEAELLRKDIDRLTEGVRHKRPTELQDASCYAMSPTPPADREIRWLAERLPALEKMASERRVHPAVIAKVLVAVEADLAEARRRLPSVAAAKQDEAARVIKEAQQTVDRLRARMAAGK